MRGLSATTDLVGRSMSGLAQLTKRSVDGIGAVGAAATVMGLRFNAAQEQNEIAVSRFLGSTSAAQTEMRKLFEIAKATPFDLAGVTEASR